MPLPSPLPRLRLAPPLPCKLCSYALRAGSSTWLIWAAGYETEMTYLGSPARARLPSIPHSSRFFASGSLLVQRPLRGCVPSFCGR